MELKHVIPNVEKTFGFLEFAGEGNVEQRRIDPENKLHDSGELTGFCTSQKL